MSESIASINSFARLIRGNSDRFVYAFPMFFSLATELILGFLGLWAGNQFFPLIGSLLELRTGWGAFIEVFAAATDGVGSPVTLFGFLLTLFSVFALVHALLTAWGMLRFHIRIGSSCVNATELIATAYADSELKISTYGEQSLLYNPRLCLILDSGRSPLKVMRKRFRLERPLDIYRVPLLKKAPGVLRDTFNGAKIRLMTTIDPEAIQQNTPITIQRTDYFSDRLTNNLADKPITYRGYPLVRLMDWNLDADGTLKPFETSPFSNHLGGGCLLVTGDRQIVYVRQGSRSNENAERLAPSGSGSFDWSDIKKSKRNSKYPTFQDLARYGLFRELRQEVGVAVPESKCLHILVGMGRALYRGGKPEICSLVLTRLTFHDLNVRPAEWDYIENRLLPFKIEDPREASTLADGVEQFMEYCRKFENDSVSGPLWFTCELALIYLRQCKDAEDRIREFWARPEAG